MQRQTFVAKAVYLLIASLASISAHAGTVAVTYNSTGNLTGPPVLNGTFLTLDGLATGSLVSSNTGLNAIWNPISIHDHSMADVTTGLLTGVFTMTFADGDNLFGNVFEDVSAVMANQTGPFTQTLTITGGTGEFSGAFGLISGGGVVGVAGITTSGSGTITAAGISVPEPTSIALIFGGLLVVVAHRKRMRQRSPDQ